MNYLASECSAIKGYSLDVLGPKCMQFAKKLAPSGLTAGGFFAIYQLLMTTHSRSWAVQQKWLIGFTQIRTFHCPKKLHLTLMMKTSLQVVTNNCPFHWQSSYHTPVQLLDINLISYNIPFFLELLLEALFKPGQHLNPEHKFKYVYLLAYAASVHETWVEVFPYFTIFQGIFKALCWN